MDGVGRDLQAGLGELNAGRTGGDEKVGLGWVGPVGWDRWMDGWNGWEGDRMGGTRRVGGTSGMGWMDGWHGWMDGWKGGSMGGMRMLGWGAVCGLDGMGMKRSGWEHWVNWYGMGGIS